MAQKALINAAKDGDLNEIKHLIKEFGNLNLSSKYDDALMQAVINDHLDIVKFLLEQGADPDRQDVAGNTALFRAIGAKKTDVSEFLASKCKKLDLQNNNRETALISGVLFKDLNVIKILLSRGANFNLKSVERYTAFDFVKEQELRKSEMESPKSEIFSLIFIADLNHALLKVKLQHFLTDVIKGNESLTSYNNNILGDLISFEDLSDITSLFTSNMELIREKFKKSINIEIQKDPQFTQTLENIKNKCLKTNSFITKMLDKAEVNIYKIEPGNFTSKISTELSSKQSSSRS